MGITNKEYCGTIVMEVDGLEHEVVSISSTVRTGKKTVMTMNSLKRALGSSCGVKEFSLKLEVAIPLDGDEPDWDNMQNGQITLYPACGSGGQREIYTGVTVEEVGVSYGVGKEAVRSISAHALNKEVR